MRIVVVVRPDAEVRPGGDVVQARAIARFLRGCGAHVEEQAAVAPSLRGADLAILLNLTLTGQVLQQARACRRSGTPYLLFPVFWDLDQLPDAPSGSRALPVGSRRRELAQRFRAMESTLPGARATALTALRRDRSLRRELVEAAVTVLPNSRAEADHLDGYLGGVDRSSWLVVHNGVWREDIDALDDGHVDRTGALLCVGAISPRKNTLTLVRAAVAEGMQLEVVGALPRPGDAFARRVLEESRGHVRLLGPMDRTATLQRIRRARAHVLPSHVETPGLATLEALSMGTPAVASDTAVVREYFQDLPHYVDPTSVDSVRAALRAVVGAAGPSPAQQAELRQRYDWRSVLSPLADRLGL